jgi:hypothetical protein
MEYPIALYVPFFLFRVYPVHFGFAEKPISKPENWIIRHSPYAPHDRLNRYDPTKFLKSCSGILEDES